MESHDFQGALFACGYLTSSIYAQFRFRCAPVPCGRLRTAAV